MTIGFKRDGKFIPTSSKGTTRKKRFSESYPTSYKKQIQINQTMHTEGIRLKRSRLQQRPKSVKEWGFDLTDFEPDTFQKVLKDLGIPQEYERTWHEADPKLNLERQGRGFVWQGEGILIETKNNPITGEYGNPKQREPEKDYAGYIGIEGTPEQVDMAVKLIKKYSGNKNESPNRREFI